MTATELPQPSSVPTGNNPLSPLDRTFTEPTEKLDIAQQLDKKPLYWSMKGWVQRSALSSTNDVEDAEAKARKLEEVAKRYCRYFLAGLG
ncbi:hypothetical protein F5Y18DRAFT_425259 [Xylariaceae sp. FL1019]|nr:hypothetical protein F5Y18DRAFT_425259 [Xylariaceae sp. FL1019]